MDAHISAWTANAAHLPHLIALGKTYYPPGHQALSENFLRWLYLDNPAGPATLIVAHEDEFWTGLIVLIPIMLERANQMQHACYAVNVLTHPQRRGRNLFGRMISHARELLASQGIWLLGHPNANALAGWRRQQMQFREPLDLHFAKFRMPLARTSERRVRDADALHAIPASFWDRLARREDVHPRYSPAFIAWRYLRAPHRQYTVSMVERRGELRGLRVTRRFRWSLDLMIDAIGPHESLRDVLSGVRRPTLVMHPGCGGTASAVERACWRSPLRQQFPFFVTTWNEAERPNAIKAKDMADMSGITLAASDF